MPFSLYVILLRRFFLSAKVRHRDVIGLSLMKSTNEIHLLREALSVDIDSYVGAAVVEDII